VTHWNALTASIEAKKLLGDDAMLALYIRPPLVAGGRPRRTYVVMNWTGTASEGVCEGVYAQGDSWADALRVAREMKG
jgi:hypothetical protein